jgi:Phosphotransferase enzyme family
MTIVVIDNRENELVRLLSLLKEAFTGSTVLPELVSNGARTFSDWADVQDYLKTIADDDALLFLDLGLREEDIPDALRGLEQGEIIHALRPRWKLVAYTRFGVRIKGEARFKDCFDGCVDKGEIDPLSREKRIDLLRQRLASLVMGNLGNIQRSSLRIIDSLGMRVFEAAFGADTIREIAEKEAADWHNTSIESLTSGHSGAFMLSLRGVTKEGPKALVLKVAKHVDVIQHELHALQVFMPQLGAFTGHLSSLDNEERQLSNAVYYRQAFIEGQPLLQLLLKNTSRKNELLLKPILQLCKSVIDNVPLGECGVKTAGEVFELTAIDRDRFKDSLELAEGITITLQSRGLWPRGVVGPKKVTADLIRVCEEWQTTMCHDLSLWTVLQHGDFNPTNIIVREPGSFVLIDLARFKPWPIGYDLARLALMLRLRLVDAVGCGEWFPDKLTGWCEENPASVSERHVGVEIPVCAEALLCDREFDRVIAKYKPQERKLLRRGYQVATLWDLIKVVSYQNITPFKRVWAIVSAWKLSSALRIRHT